MIERYGTDKMKRPELSAPLVIALLILAAAVVGEGLILTSGHGDYSSSVTVDGDDAIVSVHSNGSHLLDIVSLEDSCDTPSAVYVYLDESYGSVYETVKVAVGARPLDQTNYAKQLIETLKVRGIQDSKIVNADELGTIMSSIGKDIAVICISGALPDTVYDGTEDSKVISWLDTGGRLYWVGNIIGKYIGHEDSVETVTNGTSLFLGSECIDDSVKDSFEKHQDNPLTQSLHIINNNTRYAPGMSGLPGSIRHAEFGYTDGERYSVTIIGKGEGFIGFFGGDYSDYQRIDLVQTLSAGISPNSKIIDIYGGKAHGDTTVRMKAGEHIYVYLGGDLAVYGELHEVS